MRTSAPDEPTLARKPSRRRRLQRGFSLIEITIAVAILASLTALAAVQLSPASEKLRVEAEAREIASVLAEVRTRALTSGTPASIVIDQPENRLVYGNPALERRLPEMLALLVAADGDGVRIQRIVFYPEGGSTGGGFTLAGRNHSVGLAVNWLTGRITLRSGAADAS